MSDVIVRADVRRAVRALSKAGAELADLKSVMRDAAAPIASDAKQLAPRRTGTLAATVRPFGAKTAGYVRAGGARAPYAGLINYGGRVTQFGNSQRWAPITGQHFLERAVQANRTRSIDIITRGIAAIATKIGTLA